MRKFQLPFQCPGYQGWMPTQGQHCSETKGHKAISGMGANVNVGFHVSLLLFIHCIVGQGIEIIQNPLHEQQS